MIWTRVATCAYAGIEIISIPAYATRVQIILYALPVATRRRQIRYACPSVHCEPGFSLGTPLATLIMPCLIWYTPTLCTCSLHYSVHSLLLLFCLSTHSCSLAALVQIVTCMHVSSCMQSNTIMHPVCMKLLLLPLRHQSFSALIATE